MAGCPSSPSRNRSLRVSNNDSGIRELLTQLKVPSEAGWVILEATGGCERQVALPLWMRAYPVVVINARQARNCAKAANQLAKTDQIDAANLT